MDIKTLLFSFQGRINRARWWLTSLAMSIVLGIIVFGLIFGLGTPAPTPDSPNNYDLPGFAWLIMGILYLISLWMGLALYAKRWHDRGKSAWWTLIILVPLIGGLWALIECGFLRGTPGANQYGPDPLA